MKNSLRFSVLMGIVFFASGCYTTGLSLRENGNYNYSNFVYGLYNENNSSAPKSTIIDKPIKLAVAQIGENTPPNLMLDRLTDEKHLISNLTILPALSGDENRRNYLADKDFAERMTKMRKLAKDLGVDYIFLFGGSADYGSTSNFLQILDLTLVGGFIVPSNKISAEGRVAGALIDVETGHVLFVVNAEGKKHVYSPTYLVEGKQQDTLVGLRDEMVESLTDEFINKLNQYNRS